MAAALVDATVEMWMDGMQDALSSSIWYDVIFSCSALPSLEKHGLLFVLRHLPRRSVMGVGIAMLRQERHLSTFTSPEIPQIRRFRPGGSISVIDPSTYCCISPKGYF